MEHIHVCKICSAVTRCWMWRFQKDIQLLDGNGGSGGGGRSRNCNSQTQVQEVVGLTEQVLKLEVLGNCYTVCYATSQGTPTIKAGLTSSTTMMVDTIANFHCWNRLILINNEKSMCHIMHSVNT